MNQKKCENCGVAFECGAKSDLPCWCASYDVTEAKLKELRAAYGDCLCEKCLIEKAGAQKK